MREAPGISGQIGRHREPIHQITADHTAGSHEDAGVRGMFTDLVPSVLESLPRNLEQQPLLWIHQPRLLRRILEERRVETVAVSQQRGRLYIGWIVHKFGCDM